MVRKVDVIFEELLFLSSYSYYYYSEMTTLQKLTTIIKTKTVVDRRVGTCSVRWRDPDKRVHVFLHSFNVTTFLEIRRCLPKPCPRPFSFRFIPPKLRGRGELGLVTVLGCTTHSFPGLCQLLPGPSVILSHTCLLCVFFVVVDG